MKLNLDMAKKRLDYHLNVENRKSQSVLRHLSLPRNAKSPAEMSSGQRRSCKKEERRGHYAGPYTPQPVRKTHKRCMSSSESLSFNKNRRNSIPSTTGISNNKKPSDKFMKVEL